MSVLRAALVISLLTGCDVIWRLDPVPGRDALDDAPPLGPWPAATLNPGVNIPGNSSTQIETDPSMTEDLLELYFASDRSGSIGGYDIWRAKRDQASAPWPFPTRVVELSTGSFDVGFISADGLAFYRMETGSSVVQIATRNDRSSAFTTPVDDLELSQVPMGSNFEVSADGLCATATGPIGNISDELFLYTRTRTDGAWGSPIYLNDIGSPDLDGGSSLDRHGTMMVFHSTRSAADRYLWMSTRTATDAPFDTPVRIDELADGTGSDPWLSPDRRVIVFGRDGDLFWSQR